MKKGDFERKREKTREKQIKTSKNKKAKLLQKKKYYNMITKENITEDTKEIKVCLKKYLYIQKGE